MDEVALIGLTCNVIGLFFLANSIIFRKPRRVMEEFFGVGPGSLMSIKDHVLNKIQVVIGFLFLTCGFVLQGVRAWAASDQRGTVVAVCLSLLCFAALVYLVGSLYSRHSFRRHLRDFFRHHPDWVFRDHMGLTKEVGAILGVEQGQDETVEDYVRKVKVALRIAQKSPPAQAVSDRTRRLREMAPLASPGGPGAGTGPGVPRGARL